VLGCFVAKADVYAVDAIDARVAGGGAAQDFDVGAGEEAEVGEMMADLFRQVDALHHSCAAHRCVAQCRDVHRVPHFPETPAYWKRSATKSVHYNYNSFRRQERTGVVGTDAPAARQWRNRRVLIPKPNSNVAVVDSSSALTVLRARTRALHEQIESGINLAKLLSTREGYRSLLAAYLSLYRPFEAALAAAPGAVRELVGFPETGHVRLLEGDLRALGMTDAQINAVADAVGLPDLSETNALLGALYVIEGSQLGGQMIYRDVQAKLGLDKQSGASFFGGEGENTGRHWKQFLSGLEEQVTDPERAADTACAMFHYFGQGLSHADAPSGVL